MGWVAFPAPIGLRTRVSADIMRDGLRCDGAARRWTNAGLSCIILTIHSLPTMTIYTGTDG